MSNKDFSYLKDNFSVIFFNHSENNSITDDINKYYSLWKAVISQAITDSISNNKRSEIQLEKKKATSWLLDDFNHNFNTVCKYANCEPAYIQNKARLIIDMHKK